MLATDPRSAILESLARGARTSTTVIQEVAKAMGASQGKDLALQEAILTQWHDLLNAGIVAWGSDIVNCEPPWIHLTQRGRDTLKQLSRDPANPDGYMNHLKTLGPLDPIAEAYLREALKTYASNCFKATAVMVGVAAETLALELAATISARLCVLGRPANKKLKDWRAKIVLDEIHAVLTAALDVELKKAKTDAIVKLKEDLAYNWPSMTHMIRAARNDAGHPGSINPVTPEDVHAALLTFPHMLRIIHSLTQWVATAEFTEAR